MNEWLGVKHLTSNTKPQTTNLNPTMHTFGENVYITKMRKLLHSIKKRTDLIMSTDFVDPG